MRAVVRPRVCGSRRGRAVRGAGRPRPGMRGGPGRLQWCAARSSPYQPRVASTASSNGVGVSPELPLDGRGVDLRLRVLVEHLRVNRLMKSLVEGAEGAGFGDHGQLQPAADALLDEGEDLAGGAHGGGRQVPDPAVAFRVFPQGGEPGGDVPDVRVAVRQVDVAEGEHGLPGEGSGEDGRPRAWSRGPRGRRSRRSARGPRRAGLRGGRRGSGRRARRACGPCGWSRSTGSPRSSQRRASRRTGRACPGRRAGRPAARPHRGPPPGSSASPPPGGGSPH
ncbi:hypothetical protein SMICM17S_10734 [Streptomyces microflavus]